MLAVLAYTDAQYPDADPDRKQVNAYRKLINAYSIKKHDTNYKPTNISFLKILNDVKITNQHQDMQIRQCFKC